MKYYGTFVVDVESVILTAACDIVPISGQTHKVLLVDMT